jgi:hypothetical protein
MNLPIHKTVILVAISFGLNGALSAQSTGVSAELRSSNALIPTTAVGVVAPTAPGGAVVAGIQPWACDAAKGFQPVVPIEQNVLDPLLAIGTSGIKLPISPTTIPASCGQAALDSTGFAYITQAVVDTASTPSVSRGVLRTPLDSVTGALVGASAYIATTAGLDGNQPTALALGPDGSLYVGFLKNGNVKRILEPGVGTTQMVQSVGNTPQGHPARAFAFVGPNLYIASVDSLSVIFNATSPNCTGGCNAVAINDGFTGAVHTGLTSDGAGNLYFAVAGSFPGGSQVWRYSTTTGLFTFVADGGADRNGANASNFSFVPAKTNLLATDAGGNLWIGDDTSNATTAGDGRLWSISSASLATLPGGSGTAGTNVQTIFNDLTGAWFMGFNTFGFTPTFNSDGTFTATITPVPGPGVSTVSGTWSLTPPNKIQFVANPQAHLTLTSSEGVVLFSADFFMLKLDMLVAVQPWTGSLGTPISGVLLKQTP